MPSRGVRIQSGEDRRISPRANVELVVQYARLEQFCQDYARNLSLGGIFVETRQPLEVGTELQLSFALPGLPAPVGTRAKVVRVVTPEIADRFGMRPGMAMQFGDLPDEAKQIIDQLVMELMDAE